MSLSTMTIFLTMLTSAAVGAAVCFWTLRREMLKREPLRTQRRSQLLEEVSQHLGRVTHVFSKYVALVGEVGGAPERMTARQQNELNQLSQRLVDVYEEVAIAESKLLLLGESHLETIMKMFTARMAQFHRQCFPGRACNADEAAQARKEIGALREKFYNALSERYDSALS